MTTQECKRLLNHPIIDIEGLCNETGLSYEDMLLVSLSVYPIANSESRKIEAYLKTRGIQWRDLIKEGL